MAVEQINPFNRSLRETFDSNHDGVLKGAERTEFLRTVMGRLRQSTTVEVTNPSTIAPTVRVTPTHSSPTGPTTPASRLNHVTDFLTLRAADGRTLYSHLYPSYSAGDRAAVRQALQDRGYSHIYVYTVYEGDPAYGAGKLFNGYGSVSGFRQALQELGDDGLAPGLWLAPDDAPRFHRNSAEALPATWDRFIPMVDDVVSSYVMGLEMDEYWTRSEQERLGRHLDSLTASPIFVHYTAGEWEGAKSSWVDGLVYQYGFGMSEQEIGARTEQLVSRLHPLGKTFIAGEYAYRVPESEARRLGAAALRAGADGVGNGAYL